jgi:PHP family Zn ribbon phosphoesterase
MSEKLDKSQIKIMNNRVQAREIVQEIMKFGVNQSVIKHIIYLMSLNLEDIEQMKEITSVIKKYTKNINADDKEDIINNKPKIIL